MAEISTVVANCIPPLAGAAGLSVLANIGMCCEMLIKTLIPTEQQQVKFVLIS